MGKEIKILHPNKLLVQKMAKFWTDQRIRFLVWFVVLTIVILTIYSITSRNVRVHQAASIEMRDPGTAEPVDNAGFQRCGDASTGVCVTAGTNILSAASVAYPQCTTKVGCDMLGGTFHQSPFSTDDWESRVNYADAGTTPVYDRPSYEALSKLVPVPDTPATTGPTQTVGQVRLRSDPLTPQFGGTCTDGPQYWCQNSENFRECLGFTTTPYNCPCHTPVGEEQANCELKPTKCDEGPSYWCDSANKYVECLGNSTQECPCSTNVGRMQSHCALGANKCTEGPAYWCGSARNYSECGFGEKVYSRCPCESAMGNLNPQCQLRPDKEGCSEGPGTWCSSPEKFTACLKDPSLSNNTYECGCSTVVGEKQGNCLMSRHMFPEDTNIYPRERPGNEA